MSANPEDLGVLGVLGRLAEERILAAQRVRSLTEVREAAMRRGPAIDALRALREAPRPAVIAEFKRRSPSKGAIRETADPAKQARAYAQAGATAVSVLTEPSRFGGSLDDLAAVRAAVQVPVLEKDFVVDPYQIYEARAYGADLVLLIVKLVRDRLGDLLAAAADAGVTALVEVHDEADLTAALAAHAPLVGVNSRDLRTLEVDVQAALRLVAQVPPEVFVLAESGLSGPADVRRAVRAGADGVLVGEALMRADDPGQTVRAMRAAGALFVKVCGMRSMADCQTAVQAGADAVGFVFAQSPRRVSADLARAAAEGPAAAVERFGVFTTDDAEAILATAERARLTGVQLHGGRETPALAERLRGAGLTVLAATARGLETETADAAAARAREFACAGALPLLDAKLGDRPDGHGGRLDLAWAAGVRARVRRLVLAGGLTPETVGEAVRVLDPYGVDVSSGVEGPGPNGTPAKDPARTAAFVQAARDAVRAGVRWREGARAAPLGTATLRTGVFDA